MTEYAPQPTSEQVPQAARPQPLLLVLPDRLAEDRLDPPEVGGLAREEVGIETAEVQGDPRVGGEAEEGPGDLDVQGRPPSSVAVVEGGMGAALADAPGSEPVVDQADARGPILDDLYIFLDISCAGNKNRT